MHRIYILVILEVMVFIIIELLIVAMIDNIRFYINDVDAVAVEKNLRRYGSIEEELDLVGLDRRRGISKEGATLNNAISITIQPSKDGTDILRGHGSLHKFAKGDNYSLFTINEAKKAIKI